MDGNPDLSFAKIRTGAYEVRLAGRRVGVVEKRETPYRPGGGKRRARPSGGKGWVVTEPDGLHRLRHDTRREAASLALKASDTASQQGT